MARTKIRASESGQGLAEFALVVPVLLIILLSIIQFGWIFATQIGVTNSIREAARFAATNPTISVSQATTTNGPATVTQLTTILPRNVNFYAAANLSAASATYCEYQDPSRNYSIRVTVSAEYGHPLFIPIIGPLLDGLDGPSSPGLFRVSAVEQMRVENSPPIKVSTGITPCT